MKSRNYEFIFLTVLLCIAISIAQLSPVQASAVLEEIEKVVSPTEEIQIDKPIQDDLLSPHQTDIDEQPVNNEEKTVEEDSSQENKIIEKQTITQKKATEKQKQEDLSVKALQAKEDNAVKTVQETQSQCCDLSKEQQNSNADLFKRILSKIKSRIRFAGNFCSDAIRETGTKIHYLTNQCSIFFSSLPFNKITELKEAIIQYLPLQEKEYCCKEETEPKTVLKQKDIVPYYFLYSEPIKNHLEKIVFTDKITNPKDFLPFGYTIRNYEEIKIDVPKNAVTAHGTTDIRVLLNAPSPAIEVVGKALFAKLVIDIANNTLYKYDEDGFPLKAYLVATGARGTRTMPGLRIVSHKEKFPYQYAPKNCKRIFDPYSYGPYIIFFNAVNPKTGRQIPVDQFLHGNGNENSIGRKVSHGCVRTNNKVMRNELSKEVNRGDYILLINPDRN